MIHENSASFSYLDVWTDTELPWTTVTIRQYENTECPDLAVRIMHSTEPCNKCRDNYIYLLSRYLFKASEDKNANMQPIQS